MKKLFVRVVKKFLRGAINDIMRENAELNYLKFASGLFNDPVECGVNSKALIYPPFTFSESSIGDYSYIARNSRISLTTIGKFCSIGPNLLCGWGIHPTTAISTAPMFYSTMKQNGFALSTIDKVEERSPITIGNDVFIGMNVTILDGIIIGDGAIIGAGAVVTKNIPPYAIAVGNPIQIIKYRFEKEQIAELLKIKWWEFDEEHLIDVEKDFFNIEEFISKHARS